MSEMTPADHAAATDRIEAWIADYTECDCDEDSVCLVHRCELEFSSHRAYAAALVAQAEATREALSMVHRIATRGVGPDTTAEEALATIAVYAERRLAGGDSR